VEGLVDVVDWSYGEEEDNYQEEESVGCAVEDAEDWDV